VVQDEEIQNLSYQDTQAIDSILSESSKVNKNMPNDKLSILSNDLGKADVTITQSNITISNKQPLKTQQLRIIIKL
jgi:low affinity Fe/Cu permease